MDIQTISDTQFKSLTGINKKEFAQVYNGYYTSVYERYEQKYLSRVAVHRKYSMRKAVFEEPKEELVARNLLITLIYLKNYMHYDVIGAFFNMTGSNAKQLIDTGLVDLHQALDILGVLPKRNIGNLEDLKELEELLQSVGDILVDVAERSIQRPTKEQSKAYSGKKKRHTVKNTIISTTKKVILFIGYTVYGKKHDYRLFKDEFLPFKAIVKELRVWVDLGYLGIKKDFDLEDLKNLMIPYKKPYKTKSNPNPELSDEQKEHNKEVAKTRILVEHAIGGMKIFRILKDVFRNHFNIADQVVLCCAGLWNLKLKKL